MTPPAGGPAALRRRLAELVARACDGQPSVEEAERAESLAVAGVSSLDSLRIIDAVEREFGVALRIEEDPDFLDSVDGIAAHLLEQGLPVEAATGAGSGESPR